MADREYQALLAKTTLSKDKNTTVTFTAEEVMHYARVHYLLMQGQPLSQTHADELFVDKMRASGWRHIYRHGSDLVLSTQSFQPLVSTSFTPRYVEGITSTGEACFDAKFSYGDNSTREYQRFPAENETKYPETSDIDRYLVEPPQGFITTQDEAANYTDTLKSLIDAYTSPVMIAKMNTARANPLHANRDFVNIWAELDQHGSWWATTAFENYIQQMKKHQQS